jgi:hypothetical protein
MNDCLTFRVYNLIVLSPVACLELTVITDYNIEQQSHVLKLRNGCFIAITGGPGTEGKAY